MSDPDKAAFETWWATHAGGSVKNITLDAWVQATTAERERCLRILEDAPDIDWSKDLAENMENFRTYLSAAIRGEKEFRYKPSP